MAPDTLSLQGKVAIITGSGRENGIGAAIALALARNGASVTINYVSESTAPRAAKVAEMIEQVGGKAAVVRADIASPEGAARLVQETLEAFQTERIDILSKEKSPICILSPRAVRTNHGLAEVNNATVNSPRALLDETKETIDAVLGVCFYGPIYMIQNVTPKMPPGGRIINIGSVSSKTATTAIPMYAAAKGAMDTLSFAASMEVRLFHHNMVFFVKVI